MRLALFLALASLLPACALPEGSRWRPAFAVGRPVAEDLTVSVRTNVLNAGPTPHDSDDVEVGADLLVRSGKHFEKRAFLGFRAARGNLTFIQEFNGQVISTYEVESPEVGAGGRYYFSPAGPFRAYVLSWVTLANPEFRVVNPLGDALGPQLSLRAGVGIEIPVDRLAEWRGLRLAPFVELNHIAPLFPSQDVQGQVEIDLEGTVFLAGLRFGF
jgi:hypothetical protein